MQTIELSRGKKAIIDDQDYDLIKAYRWYALSCSANKERYTWYAYASIKKDGRRTTILMHRLLMGNPKSDIDHRNGDGLDNRRTNLRLATPSQNQANCRLPTTNKSGIKGVYWHSTRHKWTAQIRKDNLRRHLGLFETKEDAGAAYASAAERLFGEFARL